MEQNKHRKSSKKYQNEGEWHGRIGRLEENTLSYYRRVNQTLADGFSDESDEKELFIKNVFNTLCDEALKVSQNQTVSNIVEQLLHEATLSQIIHFGLAISKDWELACTDRFASHVTQTFLIQLSLTLEKTNSEDEQDAIDKGYDLILELYAFLMSNLAFHMQNTYTSHIVRVMLEVLGGTKVSDRVIRSSVARHSKGPQKKELETRLCRNGKFAHLLREMCEKISQLKKISDHLENNLSNPVLQTMLLVLHETDKSTCHDICQKLVEKTEMFITPTTDDEEDGKMRLSPLIQHEIASHYVEQVISVANVELFEEILDQLKPQILAMAVHPVANFVLQKLIKSSRTAEQFEKIFKKLSHHVEDILGVNHPAVVTGLAEGCVRHGTRQEKLLKALMKAFHCYEPIERQMKCAPLFGSLMVYETFYKSLHKQKSDASSSEDSDSDEDEEIQFPQLTSVNLHGSLLLQQLLRFGNPKVVVTSLLQMKPVEIKAMSCDPCGSHVIDVFMTSGSVGEKSRDVLYQRLKGLFLDLACHKHGSRTLDALFVTAPMRHKLVIAEELARHEAKLRGDRFGRIMWSKYSIGHFSRNKEQWKKVTTGQDRKRAMFEGILEKEKSDKAKPKSQKRKSEDSDEDTNGLQLKEEEASVVLPAALTATGKRQERNSSSKSNERDSTDKKKKKPQKEEHSEDIRKDATKVKSAKKKRLSAPEDELGQPEADDPGKKRKKKKHKKNF